MAATLAAGFPGAAVATLAALVVHTTWSATAGPPGLDAGEHVLRGVALAVPWLTFGWVLDRLAATFQQRVDASGELRDAHAALAVRAAELEVANERLEHANQELERSNRDLEQFANIASHDLREPLRVVEGFVDLLERRAADRLDADHLSYMTAIRNATGRMQELIDDVLAWSRAGSAPLKLVDVNASHVLDDVQASLAPAIAEAGAVVEVDRLPTIRADAGALRQVFQNLVANAVKFRGEEPPRIRVRAVEVPGAWRFSVRDNGIGIDPDQAPHVFEMFKRLHGRGDFPGTGVGLAICATVVERHGGRIWVEPSPGGGSTFLFTLPTTPVEGVVSETSGTVARA